MTISNPTPPGGIIGANQIVFDAVAPAAWADLDLSPWVGAQRTLVLLHVAPAGNIGVVKFKTKGEIDDPDGGISCTLSLGTANEVSYILVITDAAGEVEWDAGAIACILTMLAYQALI